MEENSEALGPKKLKQSVCVICCKEAHSTDKKTIFTKLLINQMIPGKPEESVLGLQDFEYCVACIEILEDILQLQIGLEYIQKNIKQKNLELKTKMLATKTKSPVQDDNDNFKTFRKRSTRDFRPTVQMSKKNELSLIVDVNILNECNILYCSENMLLSPTPEKALIVEKDKVGSRVLNEIEVSRSPLKKSKNEEECSRSKIHPEIVSLESNDFILLEEESIGTFEPENDKSVEENEKLDEIIYFDFSDDSEGEPSRKSNHEGINNDTSINPLKSWEKPILNYSQLCFLAIMTSPNMRMKIPRIFFFLKDNFPYFQFCDNSQLRRSVRNAVYKCKCITGLSGRKGQISWTVKSCNTFYNLQNQLYRHIKNLVPFMAFPERVFDFKEALLKEPRDSLLQKSDNEDFLGTSEPPQVINGFDINGVYYQLPSVAAPQVPDTIITNKEGLDGEGETPNAVVYADDCFEPSSNCDTNYQLVNEEEPQDIKYEEITFKIEV